MRQVYLFEKYDQAVNVAKVMGIAVKGDKYGYLQDKHTTLIWSRGHLLELIKPEEYSADYMFSNLSVLPILPVQMKLKYNTPDKGAKLLLSNIKKVLSGLTPNDELILATDPDREGELIGRELISFFGCKAKVSKRLWLSALDKQTIQKALNNLIPANSKMGLYYSALARSHADWLVGMNFSRIYTAAYSKGFGDKITIGRVQTPTLALVVKRDLIIENFMPYNHYSLKGIFQTGVEGRTNEPFETSWIIPDDRKNEDGYCIDLQLIKILSAQLLADNCPHGTIVSASTERKQQSAPLPFKLSEIQSYAAKRLKISPNRVLEIVQTLYDQYKLVSYPRTSCPYLPSSQKIEVPEVLSAVAKLNPHLSDLIGKANPNRPSRVWNDKEVEKASHHAIIPTMNTDVNISRLNEMEKTVYELIVIRYLAQFYPDYEYDSTIIIVSCLNQQFKAIGNIPKVTGWKVLLHDLDNSEEKQLILPLVEEMDAACAVDSNIVTNKTSPPPRFTYANITEEMETLRSISKELNEDPKLKTILKSTKGLGTAATRGTIIDKLIKTGYLEVNKKQQLLSTQKGRDVIKVLPEVISDPVTTAKWEMSLAAIEEGRVSYDDFITLQKSVITKLVEEGKEIVKTRPKPESRPFQSASKIATSGGNRQNIKHKKQAKQGENCPQCGQGELILREFKNEPEKQYLGCSTFKFDKSGCNFFQWAASNK